MSEKLGYVASIAEQEFETYRKLYEFENNPLWAWIVCLQSLPGSPDEWSPYHLYGLAWRKIHASYREESGISGPPRSPRPLKKGISAANAAGDEFTHWPRHAPQDSTYGHLRLPSPGPLTMPKACVWTSSDSAVAIGLHTMGPIARQGKGPTAPVLSKIWFFRICPLLKRLGPTRIWTGRKLGNKKIKPRCLDVRFAPNSRHWRGYR